MSVAKTQPESVMAIRPDLVRQLVFVAQPLAEHREAMLMREARVGKIDSQTSRIPLQHFGRVRQGSKRRSCCYFSFLKSISSPNSSGFPAFFVRSATMVAEFIVSFGIT